MTDDARDPASFVRAHAPLGRAPLVPEIRLHLASEVTPLWHATEAWLSARGVPPPFWAFAWAGGQGLARFVLDRPDAVRGLRVVDFACGGGIVGVAAALAGAARVVAIDVDPFARAATLLNADANGVAIDARCEDVVGQPLDADVVLAGDVCYEREPAARFVAWLRDVARRGARVLVADPGRAYVPSDGVRELARFEVPTPVELEGTDRRVTRILDVLA